MALSPNIPEFWMKLTLAEISNLRIITVNNPFPFTVSKEQELQPQEKIKLIKSSIEKY